jgi:hypothetical protein
MKVKLDSGFMGSKDMLEGGGGAAVVVLFA